MSNETDVTESAPNGGGVNPPAAPGAAPNPVAEAAPASTHVFTEAELNSRLAQQRAQFEKQIERMQLRVEAIATGVSGADVLLERIDRKQIAYDETTRKPTNLKELLEAQRTQLAAALGFPTEPGSVGAGAPGSMPAGPPAVPTITPTNGAQPVSSIKLTRAAIEAMSPAEINANWEAIQGALRAGLIR